MPLSNQPGILLANFQDFQTQITAVRKAVFVDELGIDPELEWDNRDENSVYAIAISNDQVVAVGRLLPDGQLGRVAVLHNWRHQGIGTQLINCLLDAASSNGMENIYLSSQSSAVPFYEKLGFNKIGNEYIAAGIAHQGMTLLVDTSVVLSQ